MAFQCDRAEAGQPAPTSRKTQARALSCPRNPAADWPG
ncbi:hypothetical protein F3J43_20210 [Pantoea sp. Cy-639]|nr:hypothetical protein [Pantoea sp. Cy-639]